MLISFSPVPSMLVRCVGSGQMILHAVGVTPGCSIPTLVWVYEEETNWLLGIARCLIMNGTMFHSYVEREAEVPRQ